MRTIKILDSTLRDGAQGEGINFSLEDKLNIVTKLDKLGISYIEAGNPFSNPKDAEFFREVSRMSLKHATLVAFGSTRHHSVTADRDKGCQSLLEAGTKAVCIFGKSWDMHVTQVLGTTLEENLNMISDTVRFFKNHGKEVIYDAEHFFDGYKANAEYALKTLQAAAGAGADSVVLCDTNGACFPSEISKITACVVQAVDCQVGIHCHNDTGCAVANSMMAVEAGASQVQGTYIGFGERCGNANLSAIIANLQLKQGYECIPAEKMRRLTKTARYIAEIANLVLPNSLPYVGKSAFSHKGGMHVDGVTKNPHSFEHVDPEQVGNHRNLLLSEVSGRSAIAARMSELDSSITRNSIETAEFIEMLKERELEGYQFESADASLEIFALKYLGKYRPAFELEYFKILGEQPAVHVDRSASAMVKVKVDDRIEMTAAEGDGPVHALDVALRRALEVFYPSLHRVRLVDYKVRVIEGHAATAAMVRVIIVSTDGESTWTTVGVSADIIDASWQALRDSIEYKLLHDHAV